MIEKTVRMSLLFDFYGQLLTERQREFFSLYYDHDLSLGEIAQQFGVSRQAVYDILRRSTQVLIDLEKKLELVRKHEEQTKLLSTLDNELAELADDIEAGREAAKLLARVETIRQALDGLR